MNDGLHNNRKGLPPLPFTCYFPFVPLWSLLIFSSYSRYLPFVYSVGVYLGCRNFKLNWRSIHRFLLLFYQPATSTLSLLHSFSSAIPYISCFPFKCSSHLCPLPQTVWRDDVSLLLRTHLVFRIKKKSLSCVLWYMYTTCSCFLLKLPRLYIHNHLYQHEKRLPWCCWG